MRSGSTADPVSWCHDEEQNHLFHWFFFFFPPQFSSRTQQTVLIKPWLKTEFSTFNLLNPLISYWRNLPGALPYGLLCSQHVTPWNARLQTKLTHAWVMPCFLLMGAILVHSRVAFPCPPAARMPGYTCRLECACDLHPRRRTNTASQKIRKETS